MRTTAITLGHYYPSDSPVHRIGAGVKITALLVFLVISSILVRSPALAGTCAAAMVILYGVAGIPWRVALRQLRGPVIILAIFAALLWWRTSAQAALTQFLLVLAAVAAAILLTLTTRISAMMDVWERWLTPLGALGLPVQSIVLALSLTLRLVPLQAQALQEVLDARKARGAGNSVLALGVPLIIRTLLRARALGEALVARGAGD